MSTDLYKNCFDIDTYFNNVNLDGDQIDPNGILIILCCWKRPQNIVSTLTDLNNQTFISKHKRQINLCIWNNNYETKEELDTFINKYKKNILVSIYHSKVNIGGISRFVLTKYVCDIVDFDRVIFIDDDQMFKNTFVEVINNKFQKKSGYHWYGKIFYKDKGYWDAWKNYKNRNRTDFDYTNFDDTYLHYGATCSMIIDTDIFKIDDFYLINKKYQFVEDLWMSYYAVTKLGYVLYSGKDITNLVENMPNSNDVFAQWTILKDTKDVFFGVLREQGRWDV